MITGCCYYGYNKPTNPQTGDLYMDTTINKPLLFNGNIWIEVAPTASREQQLEHELRDLKDFMKYKGITDIELEEFIASRRLVERMQTEE